MKPRFFVTVVLVLGVMLGVVGPTSHVSQAAASTRLDPVLRLVAAQQPGATLGVIVQKAPAAAGVEALTRQLGGEVTLDLGIINAFAARLPARAVAELAAAPGVKWVSLDAGMQAAACASDCVSGAAATNAYLKAIRADAAWGLKLQGRGIGVAVVDSGVNFQQDLYTLAGQNRVVGNVRFNTDYNPTSFDNFGHGNHVAGVVGGDGDASGGQYMGVAPLATIVNVKVSNDDGSASVATVVAGLQWVLNNRNAHNIRVVNLSLNSSVYESYHTSPLSAAVEVLWFNKIVVVVSAGNNGTATLYPPANDPFVITVGAVDDKGTPSLSDDALASFSAYGKTADGVSKPDLVAPGRNIIALMGNAGGVIPQAHPANKVGDAYFRMSGTSAAAPMVAAAAAILLEDEPGLTPDQVKYRLMATANKSWSGYSSAKAGAGYLDVYEAVKATTTQSANTNWAMSRLVTGGSAKTWNSVSWSSVSWSSVSWSSVSWSSVSWSSDYWGP